jgi:hypothetical protein
MPVRAGGVPFYVVSSFAGIHMPSIVGTWNLVRHGARWGRHGIAGTLWAKGDGPRHL